MKPLLTGKRILLGVTGSISAYKSATLASRLTQLGAEVDVILTENGAKLIGPAAFEGVTRRKCHTDTFECPWDWEQSHVTIGSKADLAIIAPCSANMLAKVAHGIADDKLSTSMLPVKCPIIIAPAMNVNMYENVATQANIAILKSRGFDVLEPESGHLACGVSGKGRMPEPEDLIEIILQKIALDKVLGGKRVLVTAGATREAIDDVRCITNPSTGKMGYACAKAARMAGADVTLVSAPTSLKAPIGVHCIPVISAQDMAEAVFKEAETADIIIMAAAVSDFTPVQRESGKIHKTDAGLTIELKHTTDILKGLGAKKRGNQFLCGFCMETEDLVHRAEQKLHQKNLDLIVANDLTQPGCGFAGDTNGVILLSPHNQKTLPVADKLEIAIQIISEISALISAHTPS